MQSLLSSHIFHSFSLSEKPARFEDFWFQGKPFQRNPMQNIEYTKKPSLFRRYHHQCIQWKLYFRTIIVSCSCFSWYIFHFRLCALEFSQGSRKSFPSSSEIEVPKGNLPISKIVSSSYFFVGAAGGEGPWISSPVENVTVSFGDDAVLTCIVDNLGYDEVLLAKMRLCPVMPCRVSESRLISAGTLDRGRGRHCDDSKR